MEKEKPLVNAGFKSYLIGVLFSVVLVLLAYFIVTRALLQGMALDLTIVGLGLLQAWVLLALFINLHLEGKSHWNLIAFLFMILVTLIVVLGSLWIMYHLNYNLMSHG